MEDNTTPEALLIEDFELRPYSYDEERDEEGRLRISARVRLSESEGQRLRELLKTSWYADEFRYVSVVRPGISDDPTEMRFGNPLWSEHEGFEKHELILMDRAYEGDKLGRWPNGPQTHNTTEILANAVEFINEILALLMAKGLITQEEGKRITEKAYAQSWERLFKFWRVSDLDEYE